MVVLNWSFERKVISRQRPGLSSTPIALSLGGTVNSALPLSVFHTRSRAGLPR